MGGVGQQCRDITDHYNVEAVSSWDTNWPLKMKVNGKNATSAGFGRSAANLTDNQTVSFRVMPKTKDGTDVITTPIEKTLAATNTKSNCGDSGVTIYPIAPYWNDDENFIQAQIYPSTSYAGLGYEYLKTYDKDGKTLNYKGEGVGNVARGENHYVIVPKNGEIHYGCQDSSKNYKMTWDQIKTYFDDAEIDLKDGKLYSKIECNATGKFYDKKAIKLTSGDKSWRG